MLAREIERAGVPVAIITAMSLLAQQIGASRTVMGVKIPHPCGDPSLPEEADLDLRREIVMTALNTLQKDVSGPTIFTLDTSYK